MKFLDKRRIASYYKATDNEVYIDLYVYGILKVLPEDAGFLPRPSKSRNIKFPYFLKVLRLSWSFFGAYLFFVYQFFFLLFSSVFKHKNKKFFLAENLGLGFSDKAMEILNKENGFDFIETWIVVPWLDNKRLSNNKKIINILELLSISDLWKALKLAFLAHLYFRIDVWKLQTYTAFRWFLVRLVLEKVNSNFYTTEHYDRWAILIDELVFHKQKINSYVSLTIVQHGIVHSNKNFILPVKIYSTKTLFVYDDLSKDFFINSVLPKKDHLFENLSFSFFQNKIVLTPINDLSFDLIVLIVGNSICLDLHLKILNFFSPHLKIRFFYKPHPTQEISSIVMEQKWEVILDKFFYPKVDLLISYPSTLVTEYASCGIDSVVHDLGFDSINLDIFLDEVMDKINLKVKSKKSHGLSNL